MLRKLPWALAVVGVVVALDARAEEPTPVEENAPASAGDADAHPFSVAVLVGGTTRGFDAGFGARIGYSFSNLIYVGAHGMVHSGGAGQFGGEGGYPFLIKKVIIRPFVGMGPLFYKSNVEFAVWTGATGAYRIGDSRFAVGGEFRLLFPVESGKVPVGFFAMASTHL